MIVANDPTVKGGSYYPITGKQILFKNQLNYYAKHYLFIYRY